jgi:urocanate hydratase
MMKALPIEDYPAISRQAAAIMLMIQNNLDYKVAKHPHELITYGGNGAVFQKLGSIFDYHEILI